MDTSTFWIATAVYGVAFGVLSSLAASRKNRSSGAWFFIGFLFGIFGLAAALIVGPVAGAGSPASDQTSAQRSAASDHAIASTDDAKCPFCAEMIKREASVCRYCGRDLPETWVEDQMSAAAREATARIENERAQAERDAAERAASETADMERYGITHDGEHFWFGQYRYTQLSDAVSYAKLMESRGANGA